MSNITFHIAEASDIAVLVENRISFALELSGGQPQEAIAILRKQTTNYFEAGMKDGTCVSCIARMDKEVAGIGSFIVRQQPGNFKNPSGRWAYVMNMYTLPQFRKKGVCTGILKQLTDVALQMGITALELHATKEGERVYTQHGFAIHSEPTLRKYL
jgi:hypothetical protein